jgi:MFS family permease
MSTTEIAISDKVTPIPGVVRRNTWLLAGVQCVGWVALQTLATLGGISADAMGEKRLVGVPVTLGIVASAIFAPLAGRSMDRLGRKPVLAFGLPSLASRERSPGP